MKKKNLKERLISRKIKTPNKLIAKITVKAFQSTAKKHNVQFVYDQKVKQYQSKQIILLSQHCSRDEYIYTLAGFPKYDMHCVIGYQNFFKKHIYGLLIKAGAIAKYLYQPDSTATNQMLKVVNMGQSLAIFPEGIQSASGETQPINPATMKFLMKCKLPVVLCTSHGSYLTRPRYSAEKRIGKMTFTYQLLFSEEDFVNHSVDELYQKLLNCFCYDDFAYNRMARIPFKGKCSNLHGVQNILYKCPHCHSEFELKEEVEALICGKCGYSVTMDEYCLFATTAEKLYFDDVNKWYNWQRRQVREEVQKEDFCISAQVDVLDINLQKLKNYPDKVGEGTLTIANGQISFVGTRHGQNVQLQFDIKAVPSMPFNTQDHSVEMYYNGEYYRFIPKENKLQVVKWTLATEEINSLCNEQWAKARRDVYGE